MDPISYGTSSSSVALHLNWPALLIPASHPIQDSTLRRIPGKQRSIRQHRAIQAIHKPEQRLLSGNDIDAQPFLVLS